MAVENSFGGPGTKEKAKWLVDVTIEFIQITDHGKPHLLPLVIVIDMNSSSEQCGCTRVLSSIDGPRVQHFDRRW